ncbi:pyridine nucleotide-disulfide oxidoreductase [Streptomyces abyssalis]|uniref:Pyridine nucleotide-disulfide oxidoreductase n=1 Tax=Streptomyces abyssalis TaxID=933944 RepID=A0A1E7JTL5_9ACTN|nr:NAD(P)/FAD-dependent oxidoreductase [Streptomyces abyssalis]OEU92249.1 pyridine nucleotide-disulfide oxidoreductase [Streptomyces abyssalis]OEU94308.1 pyridine nucleotide-disulfide oxidoreductase [Streptomyces abyssalis]
MPADEYDVIVIGAGPVGENVADRAHATGLSAVVVESELVGGDCSYWACIPSKALLRPVSALADARRVAGAAQAVDGGLNAEAVLARRTSFVSDWQDDGQAAWLDSVAVDLVRGHGRLDGPRRVVVETPDGSSRTLTARHAVAVCTGSRAALPDLPGIVEARPWTSREATSSKEVPRRLAVVGGGAVGVEMATVWQALGAEVTVLVRGDRLLPRMEPFAGELVAGALTEAGASVRTGISVESLERPSPDRPVTLTLSDGGRLEADEVLFATGRAPRTDDIGLETVGCEPGNWLTVDDSCRVKGVHGGWLYAVGDANGRALLTHQGKYQARIAGSAIGARAAGVPLLETDRWGAHAATADHDAVPQVVFTDPEATSVGLTAAEAEDRGLRVRVVDQDMGEVAGAALYADGYRGRARMVVDLDREVIVGLTFVGPGVSELLHSASIAVAGEVPMDRLWHAVPSFPSVSEVWLRLLEGYRG